MAKGIMYINGQRVAFDGEKNVLAVIRKAGINMPTLCYYSDLSVYGACRMCVVEDDRGRIDASCSMEPRDGLSIQTNTARLLKYRRMIIELLLASHDRDCTVCEKSSACELRRLALRFGVRRVRFEDTREQLPLDTSSPSVVRDPNKCILCGDCVRTCEEIQGMNIIDFTHRSADLRVMPAFDQKLAETDCIGCGQCAAVCPTAAITVYNDIGRVWRALHDKNKRVVFQIAPAVRVAIGEAFGLHPGENAMGKMVAALRLMGAAEVFDTSFAADLTTVVEAKEFMDRLKNGGTFPMFTSCCPAWVKYVEYQRPELLRHISSCKSPMEMFAAVLRDHYEKNSDGREVYHVAVMPCTAKKFEIGRDDMSAAGDNIPDVDISITTRELGRMIERAGIKFTELPDEDFDPALGESTGAATIFGATGGVMEAALRTAVELVTGETLEKVEFHDVRGTDGIKEASYDVGGLHLNVCVASGLTNCDAVLKAVQSGEKHYDFIEFMACPGGCVNGGGQPTQPASVRNFTDLKALRAAALYGEDDAKAIRKSHENPLLKKVYAEYLGEPGGHKAHHILHTSYVAREKLY